ncbi:DarT1-associated NADAR antitoxin family protein [Pseudomonas soli]|uniref:DarT1-associated NADAR antitoxin family protein n=1 Tax=Pseudomonas soli TaxID=1306993 RepID=UPI003DA8F7DB
MASRPVFIPVEDINVLVEEVSLSFSWHSGFAAVQKKKNIEGLHFEAERQGIWPVLEISTKSDDRIGQRLSAFNLKIDTPIGEISIESAFQGSKVFETGGPYHDLYHADSRSAKKDHRLRESGKIIGFDFFGDRWPAEPKTAFYDWLYLKALQPHQEYLKRLFVYKGFSDIEFNPEKSLNCQARSCAMLVSLLRLDSLDRALETQAGFISAVRQSSSLQPHSRGPAQGGLL